MKFRVRIGPIINLMFIHSSFITTKMTSCYRRASCIISDSREHDATAVHSFIGVIVAKIKVIIPGLKKVFSLVTADQGITKIVLTLLISPSLKVNLQFPLSGTFGQRGMAKTLVMEWVELLSGRHAELLVSYRLL